MFLYLLQFQQKTIDSVNIADHSMTLHHVLTTYLSEEKRILTRSIAEYSMFKRVYMYIYIYVYLYFYICVQVYTHIYTQRHSVVCYNKEFISMKSGCYNEHRSYNEQFYQ